jgi:hypothetical protein
MARSQLLILFLFINLFSFSQNANIRGFVYEKENGEPMIFTNVYLNGTKLGANTDVNGYYSISKVAAGNYTIVVSFLGYDTLKAPVNVKEGQILNQNLYLNKSVVELGSVEISAEKEENKTEVKVSVTKITPKEIKLVPSVGGEADIAQYLQVLPGVIFTGDQGGQLYIRGGSPIQNKVLLDGMIIYNPFHSIGLFSVFDTDIIRNADIYTGGYGSQYGGRISSIMDITTKDGNKKRISGKVSASPFGAKLLLEGPLKKQKDENSGSISYIISEKNSYLDQTSPILYSYADSNGFPYSFNDLYGKISFNSSNGSKLNLFGFNFRDNVNYNDITNFNWNSSGAGTNFVVIPSSTAILIDGSFAYSQYSMTLTEGSASPRTSDINGFNTNINFSYFIGKNHLKYGVEILGFKTLFNFYNSVNRSIIQEEYTTEVAGYVTYKIVTSRLVIEPGFRAHYYASLSDFSPEPRLGLKYNLTENIRIKASGGLYSQNLISATSDRDIVNLFYGFLSGPDNLQEEFDGNTVTSNLQKAQHIIGGFEYDITSHLNLNFETYFKNFSQLTNINRNKIFDDNGDNSEIDDYFKKDFIVETGKAYGIDILLKYEYKQLYVWVGYSLSYVTRYDGVIEYVPVFDRRHNLNLVTSYSFGKNKSWELGARWNLGSGFPFTQTQGFYEYYTFSEGINTDYTTANGDLGILYGDLNTARLPYYHRVDINLKKQFKLTKNSILELNAGATNLYNRENIFYFDRITFERVNQLPLLPSMGMSLTF